MEGLEHSQGNLQEAGQKENAKQEGKKVSDLVSLRLPTSE